MPERSELPSRRRFLRHSLAAGSLFAAGPMLSTACAQSSSASQRKLGVALVGLGSYSTGQLGPALRETKRCKLTGVVTGHPETKGKRWARQYGFPEDNIYTYDTMHRLADNPDIDIVYSVTPPGLHHRDIIRGIEAGKHVICEKPMAISVTECDEMVAAAKTANRKLGMGYRLHYQPFHEKIKAFAADPDFAPFNTMKGGFAYRMGGHSWRVTQELGGGGQLMNVGIYVIQSALMARGEEVPVAVTATEPPKTRPELFNEVEETIRFKLHFADGSICDGETSGVYGANDFEAKGPDGFVELEPAFSYSGLRGKTHEGPFPSDRGFNQQAAQMDAFADAILQDRPSIVPGEMGRRDIAIIMAIYEAAKTGKRVELAG